MANPWFRMYAEFATDQKVQMLSESDQRRLAMLFCLRCNDNVTLHDAEVCFLLRIRNEDWQTTKEHFVSKGFINESNQLLNWDKRQFKSDTSKDRVESHRARKKELCNGSVTLQKRKCNAIDTDTDTDTEQINKTKAKSADKSSVETLPIPDFVDAELWEDFIEVRKGLKAKNTLPAIKALITQLKKIKDAGNDPAEAIRTSIRSSWKDIYAPKPTRMNHQSQDKKADYQKTTTDLAYERIFGQRRNDEIEVKHATD